VHRICGLITRSAPAAPPGAGLSPIIAALGPAATTACLGAADFGALPTARQAPPGAALHIDEELIIVADARIDGAADLRAALADHAPPADASAATLIAAAWRRWGADCPLFLYGDYAFALYDGRSGDSFAARDHVGARPFFYALADDRLAFASDTAALLALPGIPDDLDEDFVASTLVHRKFEPMGRSFLRAVHRLEPGHRLHLTGGEARIDRWWNPEAIAVDESANDADTIARFRALVAQAVTDRLAGATQFAVHLSGGLDSSLIAAIMVPELRARGLADPPGYSWHLVDAAADPDSEPGWSEAIRARLGLDLFAPELTVDEMVALFAQDGTRGPDIRNLLHEAAIQRDAATRGVEVILSGWGGDEGASYNGRGYHPWLFVTGRWGTLYRDRSRPGVKGGLRTIYHAARRVGREFRPELPLRWRRLAGNSLIEPAFLRRARLLPIPVIREYGVRQTQHALLRYGSTTARIEDWAISGAAHGIDYRFPLLDRRLLEFIYTLPPRMFRRGAMRRWLIKQASEGLLPDVVRLNNSKTEPLRVAWIEKTLGETLIRIGDRLAARSTPPARARYIDMIRLEKRIARARRTGSGRDAALRLALQFLDIA
jgi:asparagine synthase (glutamine-hydrolysing)